MSLKSIMQSIRGLQEWASILIKTAAVTTPISMCTIRKHPPEECVGSVVIDFALCVFPVQVLPGALLQNTGSHVGTQRLDWAVVDVLGVLASVVGCGHAASFWLGLGHGFISYIPLSAVSWSCAAELIYLSDAPVYDQPHPSDCKHPAMVNGNIR